MLEYLSDFFTNYPHLYTATLLLGSWVVLIVFNIIVINKILKNIVKKTKTQWDDYFFETRSLHVLSWLIPVLTLNALSYRFNDYQELIGRVAHSATFVIALIAISRGLDGLRLIYNTTKFSLKFPIHPSYMTLVRIVFSLIGILSTVTILMGKSPWAFITGLGAFSAVLLLLFRDTILSFTSSVVINTQDLVREGDWIEVPQFNADGDVIHMGLHIIKVQNWDRTIVTIPTYKLMETTLKNWRGMVEARGRRIMRSLFIDIRSIRHLNMDDIRYMQKFTLLSDYLQKKEEQLVSHGVDISQGGDIPINKRRLTNIGTFRKYIENYLNNHPMISDKHTLMVRQLQSNEKGVPIQIYCFTATTEWVKYEEVQSDIFDHLLAIVSEFDLKVFQNPAEFTFQQRST